VSAAQLLSCIEPKLVSTAIAGRLRQEASATRTAVFPMKSSPWRFEHSDSSFSNTRASTVSCGLLHAFVARRGSLGLFCVCGAFRCSLRLASREH
jgi:hypothetical protein